MKYIFLVALFLGCAHKLPQLNSRHQDGLVSSLVLSKGKDSKDLVHPTQKAVWKGKYWSLEDGRDILQNATGASASILFRVASVPTDPQELIAISIGAPQDTFASRFSIRLLNSQIMGIFRAGEDENAQEMFSLGARISKDTWHRVTVSVSYDSHKAFIYLDGHLLATKSTLKFTKPKTADLPSANMAIGAEDNGQMNFFQGEIHQVLIWKRELSWEEVAQL